MNPKRLPDARFSVERRQIIHSERCNIVGRVAVLVSRTVQHREIDPRAKQNVPRMKISMGLAQPVRMTLQAPSPIHTQVLNLLQQAWRRQWVVRRIRIRDAHDALAVSHQLRDSPGIQPWIVPAHAVNFH